MGDIGRTTDLCILLLTSTQWLCRLEGGGREAIFVPTQTPACPPHHCADPCSVSLLLAADRPVMGIYFPQLRALVLSLSSSAWCSQVNERHHNEVIACTGTSAGLAGAEAAPSPAKPHRVFTWPLASHHPPRLSTEPSAPVDIFSDLVTNALIAGWRIQAAGHMGVGPATVIRPLPFSCLCSLLPLP